MYPDSFESATFSLRIRLQFSPYISSESSIQIRNFLNLLSRVEIFEYAMNPESGGH